MPLIQAQRRFGKKQEIAVVASPLPQGERNCPACSLPGLLPLRADWPSVLRFCAANADQSLFGFIRPWLLLPARLTRSFSPPELRYPFLHDALAARPSCRVWSGHCKTRNKSNGGFV
jgi:hypothetical protein